MRNIRKEIKFNADEWNAVCEKAARLGQRTGTYIRKIAVQGSIKFYDIEKLYGLKYSLNSAASSFNQIAKVANSTQSVYEKDIVEMKEQLKSLKMTFDIFCKNLEPDEIF